MKPNQLRYNNQDIIRKLMLIGLSAILVATLGYLLIVNFLFPYFSLMVAGEINWNLLEGFVSVLSLQYPRQLRASGRL